MSNPYRRLLRWYAKHRKDTFCCLTPPPPDPSPPAKPRPRKPKAAKPKLPLRGADYVAGPSPAALTKEGVRFVCRYLSTPGNPKNITAREAAALHKAGISVVLVFETTATRALAGRSAGKADAASARQQATLIGAAKAPIYFAVDTDPVGAELALVVSYIVGAASVLGATKTGVYGGYATVKACYQAKACKWFWQTYAWSGGLWHPARHIEQYANGQKIGTANVDLDHAVKYPYGAWKK